jgi:hypothetical protein
MATLGRTKLLISLTALLFAVNARADIYKCTDADGNVMYSQTPCKKQASEKIGGCDAEEWKEAPTEATPLPARSAIARVPDSGNDEITQQCKKRYRDQIDAIDVEMRRGYSSAQGEAYRERLRVLTQHLRRC